MKEITLSEFEKKFRKNNTAWKFELFDIVCKKCGSKKVEYNGRTEIEYGYYESMDFTGTNVIKCHKCGNAFEIKMTMSGSNNNFCQEKEKIYIDLMKIADDGEEEFMRREIIRYFSKK